MRTFKKILYALLLAIAGAVAALMIVWSVTGKNLWLYIALAVFGAFCLYFCLILLLNRRSGWKDENLLSRKVFTEDYLIDLYPSPLHRRRWCLDVYDPRDPQKVLSLLAEYASYGDYEGADSDDDPLDAFYIGYAELKTKDLLRLEKRKFAIEKKVLGELNFPAAELFRTANKFFVYEEKP